MPFMPIRQINSLQPQKKISLPALAGPDHQACGCWQREQPMFCQFDTSVAAR